MLFALIDGTSTMSHHDAFQCEDQPGLSGNGYLAELHVDLWFPGKPIVRHDWLVDYHSTVPDPSKYEPIKSDSFSMECLR